MIFFLKNHKAKQPFISIKAMECEPLPLSKGECPKGEGDNVILTNESMKKQNTTARLWQAGFAVRLRLFETRDAK